MSHELKVLISEDRKGNLEAAYITVSENQIAKTVEIIPCTLMVDVDAKNKVVGIEILAPLNLDYVKSLTRTLSKRLSESLNSTLKKYTPPVLLKSAS